VIQKGGNYGWPRVVGKAGVDPYIDPIIMWREATPPGGMAFWNGDLFVSTLRSQALIRIGLEERNGTYEAVSIERWFAEDHSSGSHGRLRDAAVGPDNRLYVLTTNRDGRGRARPGDDRILRIHCHTLGTWNFPGKFPHNRDTTSPSLDPWHQSSFSLTILQELQPSYRGP
jgi:glucose/arabinose dehydrogenase